MIDQRIDLVRELREALGMFAGAMPISPQEAWYEAIERVAALVAENERLQRIVDYFDIEGAS